LNYIIDGLVSWEQRVIRKTPLFTQSVGQEVDLLSYAKVRTRRRYVALALLITLEAALVVVCISHNSLKPYLSFYQSQSLTTSQPENQLAGLTYYRYDPNTNKLRFAASCGMILSQNTPLGVFRTAAARTIEVKDLQLSFCEHSVSSDITALPGNALSEAATPGDNSLSDIFRRLTDTHNNWGLNMDLSKVIEITINNLDCRILNDDSDLRLTVQCKRAIVNSNWPLINLRGHVIVTAADGATLESNHIIWDTRRQSFTADGTYSLRRGESRIAGKGICVDSNLNIADTKNIKKQKRSA
jgi:hypothetical protein